MTKLLPLTAAQFGQLKKADRNYYSGRWPYLSAAVELANDLSPKSCLELGPYRRPLLMGSDVMDLHDHLANAKVDYQWDATATPWPIKDKAYDLFIALQVWEHLGSKQTEAFEEVRRISRHAILSFPYRWDLKDTSDCHHGVIQEQIHKWTGATKPVTRLLISKPDPRYKRLICVYSFP